MLAALGGVASALIAAVLGAPDVSVLQLFLLCMVAGASVNGMQAFLYAVSAHSYPTEVRGSAVGMAQTVSRIGAVVSPMVAAYYFSMDPMPSVGTARSCSLTAFKTAPTARPPERSSSQSTHPMFRYTG